MTRSGDWQHVKMQPCRREGETAEDGDLDKDARARGGEVAEPDGGQRGGQDERSFLGVENA
jgi:hypothetical protein